MIFGIRVVLGKEKKGKTLKDIKKSSKKHTRQLANNIVLSIDHNKRITKYNKECERILGYNKKEVLNRDIFDFLIPDSFVGQWNYMVDYSQKNKRIDEFKLPLLDKQGKEIFISWSCFPVKNAQGDLVDINLVGDIISQIKEEKEPLIEFSEFETKEIPVDRHIDDHIKKEKSENYAELKKMIKNLKRKNSELEKENINFEKNLKTLKDSFEHLKKKKDKQKRPKIQTDKSFHTFSELVGGKKEKQEYENMLKELDEREKILNDLESKLMKDKLKINEQVNEFKKWRKKLESLETEIENRQKELFEKENHITDKIKSTDDIIIEEKKEDKVLENHYIIDKIPDSAVIIHRGILKQVNGSFADLIGYNIDEILNKSLFDFIIPENLSEVKEYYLNRLMGVDVSSFETTLLTKDNDKISVEINTKPTNFNGKKAEIAVIKTIKNKKEEK